MLLWPFIERAATRDGDTHQLLDRVRDAPVRTGIGVALLTFALGLTAAGSDDVQARFLHISVEQLTLAYRIFTLSGPVVAFVVAFAFARELRKSGGVRAAPRVRLRRNADGGFDEESIP